jgi:hypothetical protein
MAGLKPGRPLGAPDALLGYPRKQSPPFTLGRRKVASLNRFEGIPARPVFHEAELSRMVSELTRDVERFDLLVNNQRRLLQAPTSNGAKAQRQWRQIHARAGIITTKVHAILDEIALPVANN